MSGRAKRRTVRGLWATRAAARRTAGATERAGKPLWATVRLTPTMRGAALAAAELTMGDGACSLADTTDQLPAQFAGVVAAYSASASAGQRQKRKKRPRMIASSVSTRSE